jgi:hypothetical protein
MLGQDEEELYGAAPPADVKKNSYGAHYTLEDVVAEAARTRSALSLGNVAAPPLTTNINKKSRLLMIEVPGTKLQIPASGTMHAILVDLLNGSSGVVPRPVKWRSELEAVPRATGSKFIITALWEQHGLLWRDSRVPEGQAPVSSGPGAAAKRADALARASNESYTLTPRGVSAAYYLKFHAARISALAEEAKNDHDVPPSPMKRPRLDEASALPPARHQSEDRMPYGKNWSISKKAYTEHVEIATSRVWLQQYWAAQDALARFG